jgi:hypothetical protein
MGVTRLVTPRRVCYVYEVPLTGLRVETLVPAGGTILGDAILEILGGGVSHLLEEVSHWGQALGGILSLVHSSLSLSLLLVH